MPAALLILNLIDDIASCRGRANHAFQQLTSREVINRVNAVAIYARVRKIPVIWSRIGFSDDYHDLPAHSPLFAQMKLVGALRLHSPGGQWLPDVQIDPVDLQFHHTGLSAFTGNNLLAWLQRHQRHRLLLGGLSSCLSIESTVREAHERGIPVTVLEDLCASDSETSHLQSMENLQRIATITTSLQWMQP
ncbi:isochorismatase family protein [Erwinia endophytica]|uniref:cysteine hydrolase family protein n=1 Tax=Erwinia endophytica TaxID=1563158 RepID=UPI001265E7C8|nr:isochorismatase family protein [Erwinia endophytica]KAB8313065.1 isochorismatase family protein [Erwinia endophytica]